MLFFFQPTDIGSFAYIPGDVLWTFWEYSGVSLDREEGVGSVCLKKLGALSDYSDFWASYSKLIIWFWGLGLEILPLSLNFKLNS